MSQIVVDYNCKQAKSEINFIPNHKKSKKDDVGIKFKLKNFLSSISLSSKNINNLKDFQKDKATNIQPSNIINYETGIKSISIQSLDIVNLNTAETEKNDLIYIEKSKENIEMFEDQSNQHLHRILSNRIMKDNVINEILQKTSKETKINLARSNLNLNEIDDYFDSIASFINSINFLRNYLKKNEEDILKYIEPVIKEKKCEQKKYIFSKKQNLNPRANELNLINECLKNIDNFKLLVNTCSANFVEELLKQNGLELIIQLLNDLKYDWRFHQIHYNLIYCLRGILNSKNGLKAMLDHEIALNILVQSIYESNLKIKIKVIEMISPLCLWKIGREKILGAFDHFKTYARESFRFQYIVNLLAFQDGFDESLKEKLRIAIMSLINLVIGEKKSQENIYKDIDERLSVRMEFIKLGIQDIVNDLLKNNSNLALQRHLDYYEFARITDENCFLEVLPEIDDLIEKANIQLINSNYYDSKYYYDKIDKRLKLTSINTHWISVLENLFILSAKKDGNKQTQLWYAIDQIVKQVVFGEKNLVEYDSIMSKAFDNVELLQEIKELNIRLEQYDSNIKTLIQENENLSREAATLRDKIVKLENEKKTNLVEIENLKENINKQYTNVSTPVQGSTKRLSFFKQIDTSPINDSLSILTPNITENSFMFQSDNLNSPKSFIPIPPPPPPAPPILSEQKTTKKEVPKSFYSMKPVHFNKVPLNIRNETIWKNVDDSTHYEIFDFKTIEEAFSIGLDDNVNKAASLLHISSPIPDHTDSLLSLPTNPKTIFTDPVRAISATVARRRFPSSDELLDMIESMDPNHKLGQTEITNLLQFVLSPEEKTSLYSCYLPQMDELHNCLFKISKIMYYSEKLEIIDFKNSLKEKADYTTQLNNVKHCCNLLKANDKILKMFEILLCIVNYVNQGNHNGNAFGFKINFLNKLNEIKSNNRGFSLFHYLLIVIKDKYPELLNLPEELEVVKQVAIFNITDLSNEITNLDLKMKKITDLMDRMKNDPINFEKNKKFYLAMKSFYEENKKKIEQTKIDYNEAINQYSNVSKYFGESGSPTNFNEFFIIWSTFIKTFSTIRNQLEQKLTNIKKEDEKRYSTSSIQIKDTKKLQFRKRNNEEVDHSELFSVLNNDIYPKMFMQVQSGEIFKNKALKKEIRSRTKSSNLSKGTANRSRSPSIS